MKVLFRVSGGAKVGLGHIRRCLSLAQALSQVGASSFFILDGDSDALRYIQSFQFDVGSINLDRDPDVAIDFARADLIVADSYALTTDHLLAFCASGIRVAVIDDMADRELPVDIVINGSAGAENLNYRVAAQTRLLLGTPYILLRSEFAEQPNRFIKDSIRRVLITLGGSDPYRLTPRIVHWVLNVLSNVQMDVVAGPIFSDDVIESLRELPVMLHRDPQNIRELMLKADVAISAGGQTLYELAACGTPTIAIRLADNQTVSLMGLEKRGVMKWAGDVNDENLQRRIETILNELLDRSTRAQMSEQGRSLVDGRGAIRVAQEFIF